MCIAILNTKGQISKSTLKNCWNANLDGAGMAWPEKGHIKTYKQMKNFKEFYREYEATRKRLPDVNMLIHFRISTHGKVNETNCHPFLVNDRLGFIHNGIINSPTLPTSADFSDTFLFNQVILKKLPKDFIKNEAICDLLSKFIGYSKIVLLDASNDWVILNESSGIWDGDNWFSNTSYMPKLVYTKQDDAYWRNYDRNFDDWLKESEPTPKTVTTVEYCGCCDEVAPSLEYVPDYDIEMCPSCVKNYIYGEDDLEDFKKEDEDDKHYKRQIWS